MNKQDLVAVVAEAGDLPRAKAGDVLDAVFEAITKSLRRKQEVRLTGFGTFTTSKRKAGKGRNPRTGEEIKIPATTTDRKSTRLNSSHANISYAVFCLKKKTY